MNRRWRYNLNHEITLVHKEEKSFQNELYFSHLLIFSHDDGFDLAYYLELKFFY